MLQPHTGIATKPKKERCLSRCSRQEQTYAREKGL